jgi:hypothetical protein
MAGSRISQSSGAWAKLPLVAGLAAALCSGAHALTLPLAPANSGAIEIFPPSSPSSQGTMFIGTCGVETCLVSGFPSDVEPDEFVWGWEISQATTNDSIPVAGLTFPYGGGAITEPSTVESTWELDGEIYAGGGLQIAIAGFITWGTITPDGPTGATVTGQVYDIEIMGSSPQSPINVANLADFGAIEFTLDCGDVSCVTADPMATVTSMTFDYSYKGSVTPEPSTWAMLLMGFAGLGFAGYWRASASRAA